LKQGYGNHRLLTEQEFIGYGTTVESYSMKCFGVPMVFDVDEARHGPVAVEVYSVTKEQLTGPLDRLEGHPTFYCRKKINIRIGNDTHKCWLYFGNGHRDYGDDVQPDSNGIIEWKGRRRAAA
jgi:gamma-glutamylcyclotransferase (GGCT)/AIG2-like uncharacterized protein YtfP